MFGVSEGKGEAVIRFSGIVYFLSLFILKANKAPLSLLFMGTTILALTVYFKFKEKEQSVFFGLPTWIYGVVALGFGLYLFI